MIQTPLSIQSCVHRDVQLLSHKTQPYRKVGRCSADHDHPGCSEGGEGEVHVRGLRPMHSEFRVEDVNAGA